MCHWLKTVLVLGQHIFISLFNSDYNWGFENSFKIRYDVEQCEFGEWKIGHCSRTCGGGQRKDTTAILKPSKNTTTCGPLSKISACNAHSCTNPRCKKVAFLLRDFPVDFFTLQDMLFNDRVFYYGSRSGLHLYSLKIVNSAHDGSWAIGASLGDYLPVWLNPNCKATKDPGNGSCTYGWHSAVQNRFKSNQITSVSCNEFD